MFTATWPREVQKLAREFLKDPIQVNIGATDTLNVNVDITQVRSHCSLNFIIDSCCQKGCGCGAQRNCSRKRRSLSKKMRRSPTP